MAVIIDRAVTRGDQPAHTDATGVIGTVTAIIYFRLHVLGDEVTEDVAGVAAVTTPAAVPAGVQARA
jgi:hypothetical protein